MTFEQFDAEVRRRLPRDDSASRAAVGQVVDDVYEQRVAALKRPWQIIPADLTVRDRAQQDISHMSDFLFDYADDMTAELAAQTREKPR